MAETVSRAADTITLLHVDDEPDFANLAATFLERENEEFEVETATSVAEGLNRLASDDFDCVVSDYDMPSQNGIEFLEDVHEEYPNLPFILYTGKGSEEVASDAISAGVTDYLQKEGGTSQYAVLANRIRNAVEKHHTQTELTEREKRLNLFFEQSPLGVIEWNENFDFVRLNDAAEEILGYAEDELVGRSWEAIVPKSDRGSVDEVVSHLLENAGNCRSVNENMRKDGERVVCEWHNWVVTDEDGDVATIFSQFQDITARRKHERRFEAIFNNTHTLVGLLEPDGTLIEANDTALSFGGLDREDVVGKPLWETCWVQENEDARATVRKGVERARDGELFRDEIRFEGEDREAIIDFSIRPIIDERGEVTLLVPEGRDITEHKEQERKRQQTVTRVTDAIVEVDSDWRFTLVNDQAETLYDMDEEYLVGRNFWNVFAEAEDTHFEEKYRQVMETGEPTSFTDYYAGLDGWFDIDVYPRDGGGITFYFREVTDRVERSREFERQNERFQYVEEVANIGYWEIDPETSRPYDVVLSDGVYAIHGLSPDEPFDVEKGLEFYHPEDRPKVRRAVERAISDGQPYEYEVRFSSATGRERWIHTVGESIECDGEIVKVRGVFQDITERKRKEETLAQQNERLDGFASVVSHDLRNPLNVAEGRLKLAREECDSPHLEDIAQAHERMNALIDDLLTLAREGDYVRDTESVDLAEIVENCWRNVETADATIRTGADLTLQADRNRLAQLLDNLIRNAVEHGGQNVTVTVGALDDGFYVEDDGPGIPEDEGDDVFDAGYSTDEDGTGFGLNIVEQAADAHRWGIHLTEGTDGGARFEITGVEFADE